MPKKNSASPEFSPEREFAVVVERLEGQFKLFGEGQSALIESQAEIRSKLDTTCEIVLRHDVQLNWIKNGLLSLSKDVKVLKEDVAVLKTDVADIKSLLTSHDKRLSRLETVSNR